MFLSVRYDGLQPPYLTPKIVQIFRIALCEYQHAQLARSPYPSTMWISLF